MILPARLILKKILLTGLTELKGFQKGPLSL